MRYFPSPPRPPSPETGRGGRLRRPEAPSLRGRGGWGVRASILFTLLLAACTPPPTPSDAMARVGDETIPVAEFETYLERNLGEEAQDLSSAVRSRLLDQFLEEELLLRLAEDQGLTLDGGSRRLAVDRLLRSVEQADPTPGDVAAYYQEHREEFRRPERVRLRQILLEDRGTAERVHRELEEGADFVAVARRASREPGGDRGGYQGELAREDLPPSLADVIFELGPGEVSEVVEADYGYHVFQVMEHLPPEVLPLRAVADEIRRRLQADVTDRSLENLVEEARSRYSVEVYERNLPFDYEGTYGDDDR